MSGPLIIFARISPKPKYLSAAREAVIGIIDATRREAGCRTFALYEGRYDDGRLYIYEEWDDEAALAAHHQQSYTRSVFDCYRRWLSEPVGITTLRSLDVPSTCSS